MEEKIKELEKRMNNLEDKIHDITQFQEEQQRINDTILKIIKSLQPKYS